MGQISVAAFIEAGRSPHHLLSFPTDTVPALASRPDAAALIYAAKQRQTTKPLILMGGQIEDLWPYVAGSATERGIWQRVAEHYWPGALTLVLPASDRLPLAMNPANPGTVGIRVPNRAIARHLLLKTGPLATTSLNRSGEPPLQTIEVINDQFPQVLTLNPEELAHLEQSLPDALGAKFANSGLPSTVAQWVGSEWQTLRVGAIALPADAGHRQPMTNSIDDAVIENP